VAVFEASGKSQKARKGIRLAFVTVKGKAKSGRLVAVRGE
jgi:hypothetical protein